MSLESCPASRAVPILRTRKTITRLRQADKNALTCPCVVSARQSRVLPLSHACELASGVPVQPGAGQAAVQGHVCTCLLQGRAALAAAAAAEAAASEGE